MQKDQYTIMGVSKKEGRIENYFLNRALFKRIRKGIYALVFSLEYHVTQVDTPTYFEIIYFMCVIGERITSES